MWFFMLCSRCIRGGETVSCPVDCRFRHYMPCLLLLRPKVWQFVWNPAGSARIETKQTCCLLARLCFCSLALDNQLNYLNAVFKKKLKQSTPALFNTVLSSPAPLIKRLESRQIKTWPRDNPGLLFTRRPKSARSSSDTGTSYKSNARVN